MMKRKFAYLEIVTVLETKENIEDNIAGLNGTILGYDFVDGSWVYSVDIVGEEELYSLDESEISTTGKMNKESNFYTVD
jgi:hypothetical protein